MCCILLLYSKAIQIPIQAKKQIHAHSNPLTRFTNTIQIEIVTASVNIRLTFNFDIFSVDTFPILFTFQCRRLWPMNIIRKWMKSATQIRPNEKYVWIITRVAGPFPCSFQSTSTYQIPSVWIYILNFRMVSASRDCGPIPLVMFANTMRSIIRMFLQNKFAFNCFKWIFSSCRISFFSSKMRQN